MKTLQEILKYTQGLKDKQEAKIAVCNQNIYATKKRIEEVKELINVAEAEVDVEKFNDGKVELQKLENALELYNNQYECLTSEKPLDEMEAKEIYDKFNKTIEKEDKKLNQEALQHIKALRELANKSNNIFKDQDQIRSILQELSGAQLYNSYSNTDRVGNLYNKIKHTRLAEEAGQKKEDDPRIKFFNKRY
ncbi:hypothetical protein [Streptococcus suis]|uniref:hypothetical protein n=1 Tax=Streptococcus suis TaxID=1307 RepID=UPI000416E35B|nr:hypothetical protein [Streptococcus suis]MBO4131376.1 hypothetical protein [Streptococcus suis]MBO4133363.1 hypothetical protein [Streptococcus suis]NQK12836.1 hypothetical protein [Streptococcus suis]HEM3203792.1 hypothetical protein [Streptococcus suis 8830]HEM3554367.1 hypothetical protein [Streptococcus suis]